MTRALRSVSDWDAFGTDAEKLLKTEPSEFVAVFALEAAAAYQDAELQHARGRAMEVLLVGGWARMKRPGIDPTLRLDWTLAATSLMQGTGAELPWAYRETNNLHRVMLTEAVREFSDRPELRLSQAFVLSRIVHEQAAEGWFSSGGLAYLRGLGGRFEPWPTEELADAIRRFSPLLKEPTVRGDTALQLGYFRMLQGQSQDALSLLNEAETLTTDRWSLFLARFFQGQTLVAVGRNTEAARAYERALEIQPNAASARTALAALHYVNGNRQTATRLLEMRSDPTADVDPWLTFGYGEYRLWPARLARLRSRVR